MPSNRKKKPSPALAALFLLTCIFANPNALAQEGRWLRAESNVVVAYGEIGERALRTQVERLEQFDTFLRWLLPGASVETTAKLEMYVFNSRRDLEEVWPGVSNSVAGFYDTSPEVMAVFCPLDSSNGLDAQVVLFHEYAHHFMLHHFPGAYPRWFVEGFAEFVATAEFQRSRTYLGAIDPSRLDWLANGAWLSLEKLLRADIDTGEDVARFYAQGWLMTHYVMLNTERRTRFSRYIAALRGGSDPIEAFEPAFGVTPAQFQRELRGYFASGIARYELPQTAQGPAAITMSTLPVEADALLPMVARVRLGVADDKREFWAARIETAAAAHPHTLFSSLALARARLLRGDIAGAHTILDALAASNSDDVETQYLLGQTFIAEARDGGDASARMLDARRQFARAYQLQPDYFPTLYAYVQTFPQPLDANTLAVLIRAHRVAPQVGEISMSLAEALMRSNRHADAIPILQSLVNAAHGGALADRARVVLEAARQGEPPPPVAEPASEANSAG